MIREKVRKILNSNATRKSAKMTATALTLAIATSSMVACGQDTAAKANCINNKESKIEKAAPSIDNTKVVNNEKEVQNLASIEKPNTTCNKDDKTCNKDLVNNNNNEIKGKDCSASQGKNCNTAQAKNCNTPQSKNCNTNQSKNCNIAQTKNYNTLQSKSCNTKQVSNCSAPQGNSCDKIKVCNVNSMLNIRKSPTSKSNVIGTLNNNNVVETLGCSNGWCKIKVGDTVGFCASKYVKPCNGSVSIDFKKNKNTNKNPNECTGSDCGIKKDVQNNKQEEKALKPSVDTKKDSKECTGSNCGIKKVVQNNKQEEKVSKPSVDLKKDSKECTGSNCGIKKDVQNNKQEEKASKPSVDTKKDTKECTGPNCNVNKGTTNKTVNSKMSEGTKENSDAAKENVDAYSQHFAYVLNQEMYRLVNNHRKNNGLKPLDILPNAQELSNIKSKDMAVNNYFDHRDPSGKYNWEKNTQFGPMNGENIVMKSLNTNKKFSDNEIKQIANDLFEMWKHSPGHNKNMLHSSFTGFGFGAYVTKDGRIYGTQTFKI